MEANFRSCDTTGLEQLKPSKQLVVCDQDQDQDDNTCKDVIVESNAERRTLWKYDVYRCVNSVMNALRKHILQLLAQNYECDGNGAICCANHSPRYVNSNDDRVLPVNSLSKLRLQLLAENYEYDGNVAIQLQLLSVEVINSSSKCSLQLLAENDYDDNGAIHLCTKEKASTFKLVNTLHSVDSQPNHDFHITLALKSILTDSHLLSPNSENLKFLKSIDFMVVGIPNDSPHSEKIAGKIDARARELTNQTNTQRVYNDRQLPKYVQNDPYAQRNGNCEGQWPNKSSSTSFVNSRMRSRNALLLITTVVATITCQLPFYILGRTSEGSYVDNNITVSARLNNQGFFMSSAFVFFNSIVFIASVVTSIFLLHEFPMKPLPQISILALFGSYMFSVKATSPNEALPLLLISVLFFLLAAAGKLYVFASQRPLEWFDH